MKQDELSQCKDELKVLREENHHLREAANSFGALAERLNEQLVRERRKNGSDRRRRLERDTPDRRQVPWPVGE